MKYACIFILHKMNNQKLKDYAQVTWAMLMTSTNPTFSQNFLLSMESQCITSSKISICGINNMPLSIFFNFSKFVAIIEY